VEQAKRLSEDIMAERIKVNSTQCAKKVVSNSPGVVDFSIGLVNSVDNLPDGQVKFLGKFKMAFGLVDASCNLPEWQAVKVTFFAP